MNDMNAMNALNALHAMNADPCVGQAPPCIRSQCLSLADGFVLGIYRRGFVQSLIFHVALLLTLALIVIDPKPLIPAVELIVDFSTVSEQSLDMQGIEMPLIAAEPSDESAEEALANDTLAAAIAQLDHVDRAVDVGTIELVNWSDAAPVSGTEANDLLAEVPSALQFSQAGLPTGQVGFNAGLGNATGNGIGIGGEIGRRLRGAGAQTGDVQISIAWNNLNDIDLHVMVEATRPLQGVSIVNFLNRRGACGGLLDVDQNVRPTTAQAVENVFWARGVAPYGRYTVAVHHYHNWGGSDPTAVELVILVDGKESRFKTDVYYGAPPKVVTSFLRGKPTATASAANKPFAID